MKIFQITLLIVLISSIKSQLLVPYKCSDQTNCQEDKMSICAVMTNQKTQTFANLCEACADKNVDWYYYGKCEDFNAEQKNEISFVSQDVQCTTHPSECMMEIIAEVCGKTSSGSSSTYDNPCQACKDQSVQSYTYGKCQSNLKQFQCTSHPKFCLMQIVVLVCGKNSLTNQLQTFSNPCMACSNQNVQSYSMGKCVQSESEEEELIFNTITNEIKCNSHPKVCLMEIVAPVCGKNADTNQLSTFLNPCLACSNPSVDSYKFGKCEQKQANDEEIEFDVNTRQVKCLTHPKGCMMEIVAPVCGVNTITNKQSTYMNPCLACADTQIQSYSFGKCVSDQNGQIFELVTKDYECSSHPKGCAMEVVALVCGKSSANKFSTFLNPCLACQDESIESYKFGKCQEEQKQEIIDIQLPSDGQLCEYHPTACMMEIIAKVCAKSASNTFATYDNPCLACKNKDTLSYTFGSCN